MPRNETFESNPEMEARLLVQWSALPVFGPDLLLLCLVSAHSKFNVSSVALSEKLIQKHLFLFLLFLARATFQRYSPVCVQATCKCCGFGGLGNFFGVRCKIALKVNDFCKGPRDASDTGKFQIHFLSSFSEHHHTSSFLSVLAKTLFTLPFHSHFLLVMMNVIQTARA